MDCQYFITQYFRLGGYFALHVLEETPEMWLFEEPLFFNDFITTRTLQSASLHGKHLTEEGEYSFLSLQITSIGGLAEER